MARFSCLNPFAPKRLNAACAASSTSACKARARLTRTASGRGMATGFCAWTNLEKTKHERQKTRKSVVALSLIGIRTLPSFPVRLC